MQVYVVESGDKYEVSYDSSIDGIAMSLETATKIAEKVATNKYGYRSPTSIYRFTKIDEMNWRCGSDYISIRKWEVEE